MSVLGLVLAGGASRRLGADKALATVGDRSLAEVVAAVLTAGGAAPVLAVARDDTQVTELVGLGLAAVADRWPGEGPAGGLVTGIQSLGPADTDVVVMAACDLPDLSPELVRRLVGAAGEPADGDGGRAVVPVWRGRPQHHLLALRGPRLADRLARPFGDGTRSLHGVLAASGLAVAELAVADDDRSLADVDTPDDLDQARRRRGRH